MKSSEMSEVDHAVIALIKAMPNRLRLEFVNWLENMPVKNPVPVECLEDYHE